MPKLATESVVKDKVVLLRLDLDLPLKDGQVIDQTRLKEALPTLKMCLNAAKKTLILGHLGRPEGKDPRFSLKPVLESLKGLIGQDILLIDDLDGVERWGNSDSPIAMLENLRFWPEEQNNDPNFTNLLASVGDVFINEAFGTSHREVASIVGLPRHLDPYIGVNFNREITALDPIINSPIRPIILILGGAKPDKLEFVDNFVKNFDTVLIGGTLVNQIEANSKLIKATLSSDGRDITRESAQHFSRLISQAKTIVWNGPVGKFEDPSTREGTTIIANAIASSQAYKLAGGGDTLAAIHELDLEDKFDHLSTGGGALLYYLAHHTLPGLDALS